MKRFAYSFLFFFVFSASCFPQNRLYQKCLEYRLKNDSEYKVFHLELDIAERELRKVKNSSVANLELGISEGVFSISKEKSRSGYSFNPYINFSLPIFNNTGLKLNLPTSKMGDIATNNFNITAFTEIYGITRKAKKLDLIVAEEKKDKALKNCSMAEKYVEKKLLKELKELCSFYLETLDKKLKEAQANIAYEQLRVQGYGEASAKLRGGKLDLLATQRDLKEAEFSLDTKYKKFLKSCGIEIGSVSTNTSTIPNSSSMTIEVLLSSLFESIPKTELMSLDGLSSDNYIQLLDAKKAYEIKHKRGELSINPVNVTAEMGLAHSKKTISSSIPNVPQQDISEQSFTAGVGLKLPGTKIMVGLDFPFDEKRRGDIQFKFGFAINPIEIWNYTLEKKNVVSNDEIERLKLQDKVDNFELVFNEISSKRSFIEWQKHMADEQLDIYRENIQEYENWLKRGIIGNSEKQRADIEYEKAKTRQLDVIIAVNTFNIETMLLFDKMEK